MYWKSGIVRDKTKNDKFICLLNDDKQNNPFCRLKLLFVKVGSNQSKLYHLKFLSQLIRLSDYKTLGTSVIYIPVASLFLTVKGKKTSLY